MSGWLYGTFTLTLFVVFVCIVVYYYNPKRKEKIEKPKYHVFHDDEEGK